MASRKPLALLAASQGELPAGDDLLLTGVGTQIRHSNGNGSLLQYIDANTFYLLLTNAGDAGGGFNGLRPFALDLGSGHVNMANGLAVQGGLTADSANVTGGLATQGLVISSAGPNFRLLVPGGPTDQKFTELQSDGGSFVGRFVNDAYNAAANWLTVARSGYAASSITLAGQQINLQGPTTVGGNATVNGLANAYHFSAIGMLAAAQWQYQGGYVGWNYEGGSGATNFINSRGGGAGGFTFYNADSSPTSTPTLLMSLDGGGRLSLPLQPLPMASGGTGAVTPAGVRNALGLAAVASSGQYGDLGGVPALVAQAGGTATGLAQDFLQLTGNLGNSSALPPGISAMGWNYQAGMGETDFFNNYAAGGPDAFAWWQKLSATSARKVMSVSQAGVAAFAQPLPVTSGGTGAVTPAAALSALGGYPASNPAGFIAAAAAASTYAPVNNPNFAGNSFTFGLASTAATFGEEIGSKTTAQFAYRDWNSSGFNNDFDVREQVTGGAQGTSGQGAYAITCSSFTINGGALAAPDLNVAGTGGIAGAWSSAPCAVSASSGTLTTASATIRYKKIGRVVAFSLNATVSNNGSGSGQLSVALPFANSAANPVMMLSRDLQSLTVVSGYLGAGSAAFLINRVADNGYPVAANGSAGFAFSGTYEANA